MREIACLELLKCRDVTIQRDAQRNPSTWSFLSKAQGGHGHQEAFVLPHPKLSGAPVPTLSTHTAPHAPPYTLLSARACPALPSYDG